MRKILSIFLVVLPLLSMAQFAPSAGQEGTTAMHADSSAFVAWATGCVIERGPQSVDSLELGVTTFGDESMALGRPGGVMDVVSLGDGGIAVLTFDSPICNEEGPDFAVFENAFHNTPHCFLELAFVEVSSDGVNFFRFPAVTHVQTEIQLENGSVMDASLIHNFAGKYEALYGTPFDLDDLEDDALLDKNKVSHVRLVDVVGSLDPRYATYDSEGHIVNDPWPTPFWSSGFDLDAVGVIHDVAHHDVSDHHATTLLVYPNPVHEVLSVASEEVLSMTVFSLSGQQMLCSDQNHINVSMLPDGVYLVRVMTTGTTVVDKFIKQ